MKIRRNLLYFSFVFLGLFYFLTKVVFYFLNACGLGALMWGLVATVFTILVGIACFKKLVGHWLAILGPLIIFVYTPIYMTRKLGIAISQFSTEKIIMLVIFECLAIIQFVLGILMLKKGESNEYGKNQ